MSQRSCTVAEHAIDRYLERFNAQLTRDQARRVITQQMLEAERLTGRDLRLVQQSCPVASYTPRRRRTLFWRHTQSQMVLVTRRKSRISYHVYTVFAFGSRENALPSYRSLARNEGRPLLEHEELDEIEHRWRLRRALPNGAKFAALLIQSRLALEQRSAVRLFPQLVRYARALRELLETLPHHEACTSRQEGLTSPRCSCGLAAALQLHCDALAPLLGLPVTHVSPCAEEGFGHTEGTVDTTPAHDGAGSSEQSASLSAGHPD